MTTTLALKEELDSNKHPKGKTTKDKVDNTFTNELVFGLCSPIGSKKDQVIDEIENRLKEYDYETRVIKLSKFIEEYTSIQKKLEKGKTKAFSELDFKILGGNEIRKKYNSNSVLVDIAIWEINLNRMKAFQKDSETLPADTEIRSQKICYIIDSLKNTEELSLLRTVYRNIFYLISVFSPEDERIDHLLKKGLSREEIVELRNKDEHENFNHGQNVRETFIEADFFLRVSTKNRISLKSRIERFLHLIFESKIITPDSSERAMYAATSAACNSACLSRQVGAAITDINGDVIATGWNDVPKFGGNLYCEGDISDKRCCSNGYCSNDKYKEDLIDEITREILNDEALSRTLTKNNENTLSGLFTNTVLIKKAIKNTRVKALIEFSRAIHAEMHAIIIGSQLSGNKMVGGKLFCTTFPCHNCARHIILAGIKEVYYIEPYKKSLGTKLHEDAITEDENIDNKVKIILFDGIAPRRYLEFFSASKNPDRKNNGSLKNFDFKTFFPKNRLSLQSLPTLEKQAIIFLTEIGIINGQGQKQE